ncbi:hypothetical protein INT08_08200 [Prosthecochloris sp. N3]|uniref:Uncharacterized protein n=1 Tax=Prosthecochloris ethylica TaxID=2743976 RepID=A0ABR9XT45_9CHLB|nr:MULTISPECIES: hypothetical protein [Prosthecochloris]MBF0585558.1 hypothetical protein [Prosthecochloris ethylica]MBF0637149.1 hypothetical protein [Prosthecochloris ethylica]NUK46788.1 hypothetical protein [Prosthecochloris ethylica]
MIYIVSALLVYSMLAGVHYSFNQGASYRRKGIFCLAESALAIVLIASGMVR